MRITFSVTAGTREVAISRADKIASKFFESTEFFMDITSTDVILAIGEAEPEYYTLEVTAYDRLPIRGTNRSNS